MSAGELGGAYFPNYVVSISPPQSGARNLALLTLATPFAGSCEKIENRLLPALSVRRSARATLVERSLRARFHLWIRRRDGSGLAQLNFFTASGLRPGLARQIDRCLWFSSQLPLRYRDGIDGTRAGPQTAHTQEPLMYNLALRLAPHHTDSVPGILGALLGRFQSRVVMEDLSDGNGRTQRLAWLVLSPGVVPTPQQPLTLCLCSESSHWLIGTSFAPAERE